MSCRQEGACLGDDAFCEFRVAHERGAEHRMAALVVVDTGLTGCIDQDFGDHALRWLVRLQRH
jgi:hypothetical protein